jgi:hypothetical protein
MAAHYTTFMRFPKMNIITDEPKLKFKKGRMTFKAIEFEIEWTGIIEIEWLNWNFVRLIVIV